jgi:hypothetical protein
MNMQTFTKLLLSIILCVLISSCEKDIYEVYEVNSLEVLPVNADKDKAKSDAQYVSILYTNYFQVPIGPNKLLEALNAIRSIGDKQIAYDIIGSKYLNQSPEMPTKAEMDEDPETFIRNTYFRFLTRQPTEAELAWMLNYINSDSAITPDLVYLAFSTSNEYYYY